MMLTMKCYGYKAPPGYCHKIGHEQFREVPSRNFYKSVFLYLPLDIPFLFTMFLEFHLIPQVSLVLDYPCEELWVNLPAY